MLYDNIYSFLYTDIEYIIAVSICVDDEVYIFKTNNTIYHNVVEGDLTFSKILYDKVWLNIKDYVSQPEEDGSGILTHYHIYKLSLHFMKLEDESKDETPVNPQINEHFN